MAIGLVGSGVVTALASDAHGGVRSPELSVGLGTASWGLTSSRARLLTDVAPRALIERGIPLPRACYIARSSSAGSASPAGSAR